MEKSVSAIEICHLLCSVHRFFPDLHPVMYELAYTGKEQSEGVGVPSGPQVASILERRQQFVEGFVHCRLPTLTLSVPGQVTGQDVNRGCGCVSAGEGDSAISPEF